MKCDPKVCCYTSCRYNAFCLGFETVTTCNCAGCSFIVPSPSCGC